MMRIGSVTEERECDCIILNAYCPKCQTGIQAPMLRITRTGRILFIPFIKTKSPCFTICPCCGFQYSLRPKVGEEIIHTRSSQLLYEECCYFLNNQKDSSRQLLNRSDRKVSVGAILALFPNTADLNYLILPAALLTAFNIYWGIIDCIRILSGHAKDGSARYIMTNRQYRKRLQKYEMLQS